MRVVIAEDAALFREGLARLITDRGHEVVAAVGDADALRLLLRDVFTAAGGTHDDWPTYDTVMADERRAAVMVIPERVYSNA